MFLIDTCVWISFLNENDTNHQKAVTFFSGLSKDQVSLFDYIYCETLEVLKRKHNLEICKKFLDLLGRWYVDIDISKKEYLLAATRHLFGHKDLSLTDCLLLSTGIKRKLQLITFDKNLQNAWKKLQK